MSMKISDGSSAVAVPSYPEEGGPPILHIDDGTDGECRPQGVDAVAAGATPQEGPSNPPADPPPKGPMPDPGSGGIALQLAAFRA